MSGIFDTGIFDTGIFDAPGNTLTGESSEQTVESLAGAVSQIHTLVGSLSEQAIESTDGTAAAQITLTGSNSDQDAESTADAISQIHRLSGSLSEQAITTSIVVELSGSESVQAVHASDGVLNIPRIGRVEKSKPLYRNTDMAAMVANADPKTNYYPTYQFRAKTFVKRDVPGRKP